MVKRKRFSSHAQKGDTRRVVFLQLCIYFGFFLISLRLLYWQVIKAEELQAVAESQYSIEKVERGERGNIYTAHKNLLVGNTTEFTLFAQPYILQDRPDFISESLTPFLLSQEYQESTDEAKRKELWDAMKHGVKIKLENKDKKWVALKHRITKEQKKAIEELSIYGIGFDPYSTRFYPEASMAAHITGFVGKDDVGNDVGYFGIEGAFEKELRGKIIKSKQEKDALGKLLSFNTNYESEKLHGRDIVLTIERDLQFMLEEKIQKGMEKYGAKSAEAVIMNPKTGEVMAMATTPKYDQKTFYTYDPVLYKNPLVANSYEPGSTFKVLTVAAGIDSGAITPESQCSRCDKARTIGSYTIKTWNDQYTPNITIKEGLAKSDNTAMIFVAEEVGQENFVKYLEKFDIGEPSGISLQEDSSPTLRETWRDIDLATASFGQGISVTGMQMAKAVSAIANNGTMMKPKIVRSVVIDGETVDIKDEIAGQPISQQTAKTVANMMMYAAHHGEAQWTVLKQYSIAGKTGTAQIPVAGHYDEEKTIASFVGFAPVENPRFVMLVKLQEPSSSPWASETAAPLWYDIAEETLMRLNVVPGRMNSQ